MVAGARAPGAAHAAHIPQGLSPPPVVADAGYGEVTAFHTALEERELVCLFEVKAATSAYEKAVRFSRSYETFTA